nr:hypothetical protein [Kibdelosporangium sp. MJ126-NF4]
MMSVITTARRWCACSGGKRRRVIDPAAGDPHGAQELDPVRVDIGLGAAWQIRALSA